MNGQLHAFADLPSGKNLRCALNRRLVGRGYSSRSFGMSNPEPSIPWSSQCAVLDAGSCAEGSTKWRVPSAYGVAAVSVAL